MSTLRYSYDSESDCGYIRIGKGDVARTESLTGSLHVDRDGHENIVGIEVLTATDPSWIPHVTNLLADSVPDASLVSATVPGHGGHQSPRERNEGLDRDRRPPGRRDHRGHASRLSRRPRPVGQALPPSAAEGCFSDGVRRGGAVGGGDHFAVGAGVAGRVAGGVGAAAPDGVGVPAVVGAHVRGEVAHR